MAVDYSVADSFFQLTFGKLNTPNAKMTFPAQGTLSNHLHDLLRGGDQSPTLSHQHCSMFASAAVEMWHRAIHSFLWSVALTKSSPLWSSVTGYYASHFVMRAVAHSSGLFKSFRTGNLIQVVTENGSLVCAKLDWRGKTAGEHAFYWKVAKGHPQFASNVLFRENHERDMETDAAHRTFANYTDHICAFHSVEFPTVDYLADGIEKISRIRLHSVTSPSRDDFPDLENVQILAFQRIIAFQDFLDDRIPNNKFWRAHRRPSWCRETMLFQVEGQAVEDHI